MTTTLFGIDIFLIAITAIGFILIHYGRKRQALEEERTTVPGYCEHCDYHWADHTPGASDGKRYCPRDGGQTTDYEHTFSGVLPRRGSF